MNLTNYGITPLLVPFIFPEDKQYLLIENLKCGRERGTLTYWTITVCSNGGQRCSRSLF
jgi:hypothetical protein